jgi:hypothetical protein
LLQSEQQQEHPGSSTNKFDAKTDKGSADLYFHYYGMLQHQQNMLQVGDATQPDSICKVCSCHRG